MRQAFVSSRASGVAVISTDYLPLLSCFGALGVYWLVTYGFFRCDLPPPSVAVSVCFRGLSLCAPTLTAPLLVCSWRVARAARVFSGGTYGLRDGFLVLDSKDGEGEAEEERATGKQLRYQEACDEMPGFLRYESPTSERADHV